MLHECGPIELIEVIHAILDFALAIVGSIDFEICVKDVASLLLLRWQIKSTKSLTRMRCKAAGLVKGERRLRAPRLSRGPRALLLFYC